MSSESLKDIGLGIGFVALQVMMFRHLEIFSTTPDLVLIYILWIITRKNRTTALLIAAGLGLAQDALLDLWGLNMFAKTLLTFFIYNFIPKSSDIKLLLGQTFLLVLIASLIHNFIFLTMSGLIDHYSAELFFWRRLFGNSLYTAVVASFIQLFRSE